MTTNRILTVDRAAANSTFQGQTVRRYDVTYWDNGSATPSGTEFNYDVVDNAGVTQRYYGYEDADNLPPFYGAYKPQSTYSLAAVNAMAKGASYSYTNRRENVGWNAGEFVTENVTIEYFGLATVTTTAGTFKTCHTKTTTTADSASAPNFKLQLTEEIWQTKDVRIKRVSSERQYNHADILQWGRDADEVVVGYIKNGVAYGNVATP